MNKSKTPFSSIWAQPEGEEQAEETPEHPQEPAHPQRERPAHRQAQSAGHAGWAWHTEAGEMWLGPQTHTHASLFQRFLPQQQQHAGVRLQFPQRQSALREWTAALCRRPLTRGRWRKTHQTHVMLCYVMLLISKKKKYVWDLDGIQKLLRNFWETFDTI